MSRLSRAVRRVTSSPLTSILSPVTGGIEALTGMSGMNQMMAGAGIGLGAGALGMFGGGAGGGIPGLAGGTPLVNGQIPAGGSSAGGIFRALGGGLGQSLIGAGASMYGANEQAKAQESANRTNIDIANAQMGFSAGQAQREMDFQERMSSTSYQRVADDMKKAGINPLMAVGNGGASSPAGAMGTGQNARVEAVPSRVANSLQSAMNVFNTISTMKERSASIDNMGFDNVKKSADAAVAVKAADKIGADTSAAKMRNKMLARQTKIEGLNATGFAGRAWSNVLGVLDTVLSRMPSWIGHSAYQGSKGESSSWSVGNK